MTRPPPLLALRGLVKRFGDREALAACDLSVAEGEFLVIVGPSGCGKSTLLRLIAGLAEPTAGGIVRQQRAGDSVGFVFQEPTLLPWASLFDNVALPLRLSGLAASAVRPAVEAALARVDLQAAGGLYPRQLSGGMRMRASLARALVTRPRLLLLDEPFAALDEITRFRLNDDLLGLWREHGFSVLMVTHSVYEAVYLANRVAVMSVAPGRLVAEVTIDLPQPRRPELRTEVAFARLCRRVGDALQAGMQGPLQALPQPQPVRRETGDAPV